MPKRPRGFDAEAYLDSTGPARKVVKYRLVDHGGLKINNSLLSIVLHD